MKTFQTPNGKVINLKIKQGTSHIQVEFATGGQLPEELSGLYTTEREANIAVTKYLSSFKDKK